MLDKARRFRLQAPILSQLFYPQPLSLLRQAVSEQKFSQSGMYSIPH